MWCNGIPLRASYPMLYGIAQRKDAFVADVLGGQNGFIHCDIHFTCLSKIGSWRVYILSLLYCIPLILIGIGLVKWFEILQRMDLSKLKSYYRALTTGGSHALPWKSIWRVKVPFGVAYFTWTG